MKGAALHQVGLPYHWGGKGLVTGDAANDLFGIIAGSQRAHPGEQGGHLRHPAGAAAARARPLTALVADYRRRAGVEDARPRTAA